MLTISMVWFAASANATSAAAPLVATVFFGIGTGYVFTSSFTYLVAAYRPYAASAMAGNSFVRSAMAAAFPCVQAWD